MSEDYSMSEPFIVKFKLKYHEIFYENADPRIRDKLFMGSPLEIVLVYLLYVFIITYLIPRIMRDRVPFDFKTLYGHTDKMLVLVELYFLFWGCYGWFLKYNWICAPIDLSDSYEANVAVTGCWEFLMSKFLYMLQSLPHLLSKRDTPAGTFIHFHHAIFPMMVWVEINYYPGGHVTFIGFMNAVANIFVSGSRYFARRYPKLGLERRAYLIDWVSNITKYIILLIHSLQVYFLNDCSVPLWIPTLDICGLFFFVGSWILIHKSYNHPVIDYE